MEKETVPHADDIVRVQRNAGSCNANHVPMAHHQEKAGCEIGIGIQQTAVIRHTLPDNIGIQQRSVDASMDDHQTTQSETNAANQRARMINITNNTDIGAITSFVSMGDRTVDTSSLSEEPRSDVAEHIQELFQKKYYDSGGVGIWRWNRYILSQKNQHARYQRKLVGRHIAYSEKSYR